MNNNHNNQHETSQGNSAPAQNNLIDTKRHRRSKHEQEGRSFTCNYCEKSYLSKPALNNHLNTKHGDILAQMNITKRMRGRPKKTVEGEQETSFALNKFKSFFSTEKRIKTGDVDFNRVAQSVLDDVLIKYSSALFKPVHEIKDSPILKHLVSGTNKEAGQKICDDIICHYLDCVKLDCNEAYFTFVVKFVLLFRECFNLSKNEEYLAVEYTSQESAEQFPEQCNEFFSSFMENNAFFGFDEEEKNELIEIIQHFCFWLFSNNYTKSKLSLAG